MLRQAAGYLQSSVLGANPKLDGTVGATMGLAGYRPDVDPGRNGLTIDDWNPGNYNRAQGYYVRNVTQEELARGEHGYGLFSGRFATQSGTRSVEQLGSGVRTSSVIGGTIRANIENDGKPHNFFHTIFRPMGASNFRNGHGVYVVAHGDRWYTGAQVMVVPDNELKAVLGNASNPLELAARAYSIQFGDRPTVTREGNAAVAEGQGGRVHISSLGSVQGDDLLCVVYANLRRGGQGTYQPGLVALNGREGSPDASKPNYDPNYWRKPAGIARKQGEYGQWLFEWLGRRNWGGQEVAVPRFYAEVDQHVRSVLSYVG